MLIRTLLFKIATVFDDKGFDDAEKAAHELKKGAKEAEAEVEKLGTALDAESKAAKKSAKETDKAGKEIKDVGGAAKKSGGEVGRMDKLMSGAAAGIAASFASAGIAAVLEGIATAIAFVGEQTAGLDLIAKTAQKTGFGVEDFQRLSHVATLSGTDVEKLTKGITNLEIQLDVIGRGGAGPAAEALDELSLSYKQLQDQDPTEQLKIVSAALEDVKDPTDRSRIAFKLMGEEGRELIPLFNSGTDAIQGMVDATGKVFTREELAKAEAYQDALAGMSKRSDDLKGRLALGLVPIFERALEIIDEIIPKVEAWAREVAKPFKRLIDALKPFIDEFGPGFIGLLEQAVQPLADMVERAAFFADVMATILEVGGQLLGWIRELLGELETRWPGAWEKAASVIDVFLTPLETARNVIGEILDFISEAAGELEGVSDTVDDIKSAIGLGSGGGGLASTSAATQAFRDAQQRQGNAAERKRDQEDRRKDKAAAREQGAESFARGEAGALGRTARRRGRRGGGGGGRGAAAPTESTGLFENLGLTAPGTVAAARPLPQTLTYVFSTVFNIGTGMTIHVEHAGTPEQERALQDAGNQARDTMMAKISDIAPALDLLLATKAKALRARAGGGQTPRGAG